MSKKVLGRGLGAFFPDYQQDDADESSQRKIATKTAVILVITSPVEDPKVD